MNISFNPAQRISLVIVPTDLRGGYNALASIASTVLNIDVSKGHDTVVFISRSQRLCKVITADERGTLLICRYLNEGRFQQLLGRRSDSAAEPLTTTELERYLNGENIQIKRTSYF